MSINKFLKCFSNHRTWIAVKSDGGVKMHRELKGRAVSILLKPTGKNGKLKPTPSSYKYRCKNSHWDFSEAEIRWTRDKTLLKSFIKALKETGAEKYIVDLCSFITVNKYNSKSKKGNVAKELNETLK